MGKKMNLPFPFKFSDTSSSSSWPWPTACANLKTLSFRDTQDIFKTMNSAYVQDNNSTHESISISISHFGGCNGSDEIVSTSPEAYDEESMETMVIRGLSSERLIFEPDETRSIMEEGNFLESRGRRRSSRFGTVKSCPLPTKSHNMPVQNNDYAGIPKEEGLAMEVESRDPFGDFRRSMEEMVEAHGLKEWDCLEKLLSCYLRVNSKRNHGYIVGAFVDLVVGLASASGSSPSHASLLHCSCSATHSPSSPVSFSSSNSLRQSSSEIDDGSENALENVAASSSSNVFIF